MENNLEASKKDQEISNAQNEVVGKNAPIDIFAESAHPDIKRTPVDAQEPSISSDHPRIKLADSPTVAPVQPATPILPTRKKRRGSKVTILMGVTIVVILIFTVSFAAFQFLKPTNTAIAPSNIDEITSADTTNSNTTTFENSFEEDETEFLDTDKDGLIDEREIELGLDIHLADSDGDGLSDKDEVDIYSTDPFNADTDGDGFTDGSEVSKGYDPNGPGRLNDIKRQGL